MLLRMAMVVMTLAGPALSQERDLADGQDLFLYFCAECHGKNASGTGPIAEMMALEPPELTSLKNRNNGIFPTLLVATQIDGRTKTVGHDMPIFGWSLEGGKQVKIKLPSGQILMVTQSLGNLIAYLESVQIEPSK